MIIFMIRSLDYLFNYYGSDKADFFKFTMKKSRGFQNFTKKLENSKVKFENFRNGSFSGASATAFSKYFQILIYFVLISTSKL